MRILFIDTSTSDVSIAIINDNKLLTKISKSIPNAHSIYTVSFIEQALKEVNLTPNDINKILVVTGPGSFTGVRIGVTIAKTYAYLKNIDIIEASSLKMMSLSTSHDYCLSLISARNNNYYLGLYDKDNNNVVEEQFNSKDKVIELINKYQPLIIGNEELIIDNFKSKKVELNIENICAYYDEQESKNPHLVVPNYLKLPQALEENK